VYRFLFASVLFTTLAATQAQADIFTLEYTGVTFDGSTLAGAPIAPGTSFDIQAEFSTPGFAVTTGVAIYSVVALSVDVGGTSYSSPDASSYLVELVDGTNPVLPGAFLPALIDPTETFAFAPLYGAATTAGWSATAPSATGFSVYVGDLSSGSLDFDTLSGGLFVTYDTSVNVTSSINAVPEPSALILGLTAIAATFLTRRRRIA
jgi:hypothetical protein